MRRSLNRNSGSLLVTRGLHGLSRELALYTAAPVCLAAALVWYPIATAVATAGAFVMAFSLLPFRCSGKLLSWLLAFLLAGYAFFGRTFAYLGFRAVYVGEVVLTIALCVSLVHGTLWRPLRCPASLLLLLFSGWCAVRTAPYVAVYGTDALRDAVIWGYAAFALVTAGLLLERGSVLAVTAPYGRMGVLFLFWLFFVGVLRALGSIQPGLPSGIFSAVAQLKAGDVAVHLAGTASFVILGLHQRSANDKRGAWCREWVIWPLWAMSFLIFGSQNRGGLLSILITLAVVFLLWHHGRWGKLALVCVSTLSLFVLFGLEIDVGAARKISPQQILTNISSITGDTQPENEGTRLWRLSWWEKIRDYTIYGAFFWRGKGFGVNLADDDGFQTDASHSLRSPHNAYMTILARAGVPGLTLWILFLGGLWVGLFRRYLSARHTGDMRRAAFIVWIIAYLTALLVNGTFDVYLEGPQGGIWFWTVVGVALAVLAGPRACKHLEAPYSRAVARPILQARAS